MSPSASQTSRASSVEATTDVEKAASPAVPQQQQTASGDEVTYSVAKTLIIMSALVLAMFLVSLDRVIIGVAIPTITDRFNSFSDITWYGSAYLLTLACSQLVWGRVYKFNLAKPVLLASIIIFEVGSVVCGAAPSSNALIAGRAIAGLGAGGIFSGCIQVLLAVVPLDKRPTYIALFQMTFGLSSALGPLLGGAFTTKVSWRWCFYINLPLGAVAIVAVMFLYHDPKDQKRQHVSLWQQFVRLDPIGVALLVPAIVCLVLALQWGGTTYAWSNARIIALFVVTGVLLIAFGVVQYLLQEGGLLPPRVFLKRAVFGGSLFTFFLASSMTVAVYYLPIWFQVIKNSSALESGYQTIPFALSLSLFSIVAGRLTQTTGYYSPQMCVGLVLGPIGVGLISTFATDTAEGKWIGYQILWGAGIGFCISGANMSVQTALPKTDVPIGIACVLLFQQLGGAIFVPVAQSLLQNQLASLLSGVPGIDASAIAHIGATELRSSVPTEDLQRVLVGYNEALKAVWYLSVALFCAVAPFLALIPWLSIKKTAAKAREEAKVKSEQSTAVVTEGDASAEVQVTEAAKSEESSQQKH